MLQSSFWTWNDFHKYVIVLSKINRIKHSVLKFIIGGLDFILLSLFTSPRLGIYSCPAPPSLLLNITSSPFMTLTKTPMTFKHSLLSWCTHQHLNINSFLNRLYVNLLWISSLKILCKNVCTYRYDRWQLSLVDNVVSFKFGQKQGWGAVQIFDGYYANEAASSSGFLESCQSKLVINTSLAPAVTSYWGVCQTRVYLCNRWKMSQHGPIDHSLTSAQHCGLILHILKGWHWGALERRPGNPSIHASIHPSIHCRHLNIWWHFTNISHQNNGPFSQRQSEERMMSNLSSLP